METTVSPLPWQQEAINLLTDTDVLLVVGPAASGKSWLCSFARDTGVVGVVMDNADVLPTKNLYRMLEYLDPPYLLTATSRTGDLQRFLDDLSPLRLMTYQVMPKPNPGEQDADQG